MPFLFSSSVHSLQFELFIGTCIETRGNLLSQKNGYYTFMTGAFLFRAVEKRIPLSRRKVVCRVMKTNNNLTRVVSCELRYFILHTFGLCVFGVFLFFCFSHLRGNRDHHFPQNYWKILWSLHWIMKWKKMMAF